MDPEIIFALEKNTLPIYVNVEKNISIEDLLKNQPSFVKLSETKITNVFPFVSKEDLPILWMMYNSVGEGGVKNISKDDKVLLKTKFKLVTDTIIKDRLKRFQDNFNASLKALRDQYEMYERLFNKLDAVASASVKSKFVVTDISIDYELRLENGENLMNVFDSFVSSPDIPFIFCQFAGKKYYKICDTSVVPNNVMREWATQEIENFGTSDYMIIKLAKENVSLIKNSDYIDVYWMGDHRVSIETNIQKNNEDVVKQKLFSALDIKYTIVSRQENKVRGEFEIICDKWDTTVFLDMIFTNDDMRKLLFINEFDGGKTALEKSRVHIFYYPNEVKDVDKSLSFIVSQTEKNILTIRISRSKTKKDIDNFIHVFLKLMTVYTKKYKEVKSIYDSLTSELSEKELKKQREKKTGKKVDTLKEFDPDMFSAETGFYARVCQHQPVLVNDADEAEKIRQTRGKQYVVEFPTDSGIFYTSDNKKDRFRFPGLKINKISEKDIVKALSKNPAARVIANKYMEEYPLLPCCLENNQYDKNSTLKKYMNGELDIKKKKETHAKQSTYVQHTTDTAIDAGKSAILPNNIKAIYSLQRDTENKRYGVINSANSFLHCVELAVNTKTYNAQRNKEGYVRDIRKKLGDELSEAEANIARQEMYDLTSSGIISKIKKVDEYFDPNLFLRIIELKYNINVFLYSVDTSSGSGGEVVIPSHKDSYLFTQINVEKPTIVIIKYPNSDPNIPYRCEVVYHNLAINKPPEFLLRDSYYVKLHFDILKMHITQHIIVNNKVRAFGPQELSKFLTDAKSQYINSSGKTYGLVYTSFASEDSEAGEVVVYVNQCAPLAIPENTKGNTGGISEKDALAFIKKYNATIKGITKENQLVVNFPSFYEAFIQVKNVKGKYKKVVLKEGVFNSIDSAKHNELEVIATNRKIARNLQEYVLYEAAKRDIRESDFVVVKNYKYKFSPFFDNSNFVQNNKIIVPNKKIINKLISFLNVQKVNNPYFVEEYKNKKLIPGLYEFLSDFKKVDNQVIFLNKREILSYLDVKEKSVDSTTVVNMLMRDREFAYYFSDFNFFDGKLCIIQNTSSKGAAMYLGNMWHNNKINVGYNCPEMEINDDASIFNEKDMFETKKNKINILEYDGGKHYAAILFFD